MPPVGEESLVEVPDEVADVDRPTPSAMNTAGRSSPNGPYRNSFTAASLAATRRGATYHGAGCRLLYQHRRDPMVDVHGGELGIEPPVLPAGREVELPGRGRTFVRQLAGPAARPDGRAAARLDGDRRPQLGLLLPRPRRGTSTSSPSTTAATGAACGRTSRSASPTAPTTSPRSSTCSASAR